MFIAQFDLFLKKSLAPPPYFFANAYGLLQSIKAGVFIHK